ncbi:cell wall-binding repeat-containing protein [Euzebya sp.]|uniref:cell wall-binding repeat-containing protein n=1 Tax=Euzebya sp. TaxID=1971409 RepID=UPI0035156069
MVRRLVVAVVVVAVAALGAPPGLAQDQGGPATTVPPSGGRSDRGAAVISPDLSGDGLDDVVRTTVDGHLVASRGLDGQVLWAGAGIGGVIQSAGDLTGDGLGDLLVTDGGDRTAGTCGEGCHTLTWTTSVRAIDGHTGAVLWQRDVDASSLFEGPPVGEDAAGPGTTGVRRHEVNRVLEPDLLPDVTGDGRRDVLLTLSTESTSWSRRRQVEGPTTTDTVTSTASGSLELQVLDGVTGAVVHTHTAPEGPSILAGTELVGDGEGLAVILDGGGTATAVCTTRSEEPDECVAPLPTPGRLEVRDLPDLSPHWSTTTGHDHTRVDARDDLTGDGTADVLITTSPRGQDPTTPSAITAVDGRDGAVRWTRPGDAPSDPGVIAVTPLEDDGSADLLVRASGPSAGEVSIVRVDGATGSVLGEGTALPDGHGAGDVRLADAGDADGDGSHDVLVTAGTPVGEPTAEARGHVRMDSIVRSGRTGAVVSTLPSHFQPCREGCDVYEYGVFRPVGDLDGDGLLDAVGERVLDPAAPQPPGRGVAVRMIDGEVLWEGPSLWSVGGVQTPTGQLDGGVGGDLIAEVRFDHTIPRDNVSALDGADGTVMWPPRRTTATVQRVAGEDRIATAVAVSGAVHTSAETVVIARADRFPDALAGGPLAAVLDAPVLLTSPTTLDPRVAAEISRLGARTAVLLGGTAALDERIGADLIAAGLVVERLAGDDRAGTAAAVAGRYAEEVEAPLERVVVAPGGSGVAVEGWADAVAGSAYGAATGAPLLLLGPDGVPPVTAEALAELAPTGSVVRVGLASPDDETIDAELEDLTGVAVVRVGGQTATATAAEVAELAIAHGASPVTVHLATAGAFPDALAASAAVGATRGVLLLADPGEDPDDARHRAVDDAVRVVGHHVPEVRTVTVVGGTAAVSLHAEGTITEVLGVPVPDDGG